jgi:hypothetical protein
VNALLKAVGVNDHSKQLAEALAEVRRLDERRAQIRGELTARVDVSYFDRAIGEATRAYEQSGSGEDLRDLLLAELVAERARQRAFVTQKIIQYGNGGDDQFRLVFPTFREVLLNACKLKLEAARQSAEAIREQEIERLRGEYEEEEIADHSLPCRRANGVVKSLEFRLKRIESDLPQEVWANNAASLLE